jgi:hypothetical protein
MVEMTTVPIMIVRGLTAKEIILRSSTSKVFKMEVRADDEGEGVVTTREEL